MITNCSWQLIVCLIASTLLTWILPRKLQTFGAVVCCVIFLALTAPLSLGILTVSTVLLYFTINKSKTNSSLPIINIAFLAIVLLLFKYRAHITASANIIPIGISYYLLREIHCLFELYKNQLSSKRFTDLLSYMFFLPTLLVGPISRYDPFVRDLRRRRWDSCLFSKGLERILCGYFKLVVLSEYLVEKKLAIMLHAHTFNNAITIYLESIINWMDLYLQFSGYSDIAIGFAALAGFTIMENFAFPFLAINIVDFWGRWHMSFTTWCRDYVYRPLLSATRKPFLSICLAMIALGFWHELSFRYILWGLYHATGIMIYHIFKKHKSKFSFAIKLEITKPSGVNNSIAHCTQAIISKFFGWFITMNFVILSYPVTQYLSKMTTFYWKEFVKCIAC
jgi:alginate O-acetyltransferase complex protein AlgI